VRTLRKTTIADRWTVDSLVHSKHLLGSPQSVLRQSRLKHSDPSLQQRLRLRLSSVSLLIQATIMKCFLPFLVILLTVSTVLSFPFRRFGPTFAGSRPSSRFAFTGRPTGTRFANFPSSVPNARARANQIQQNVVTLGGQMLQEIAQTKSKTARGRRLARFRFRQGRGPSRFASRRPLAGAHLGNIQGGAANLQNRSNQIYNRGRQAYGAVLGLLRESPIGR